jgi:hypothetical protein
VLFLVRNSYLSVGLDPRCVSRMRRQVQILVGLALGGLAIFFAADLIQNYFQTTNWGYTVVPPIAVLVFIYGGIIFGAVIGVVGVLLASPRYSRILLYLGWITLFVEASFFFTDGLFVFVLPPAIYFFWIWTKRPNRK